jgi:hypothetical protein
VTKEPRLKVDSGWSGDVKAAVEVGVEVDSSEVKAAVKLDANKGAVEVKAAVEAASVLEVKTASTQLDNLITVTLDNNKQ